jgi:polyhydroxyalkanoate synthase
VLRRPLLIVPPWINKFYILDLSPEKSFIRWAVGQGHTVFVISWVNPDERQAGKSFDDYMREGILEALDVVGAVTGEKSVNAIGYCVGGTLLAATLAYMAETGDARIASATFFTAQVDFTQAGDLRFFADEVQIAALERRMEERGYLEGEQMASAFNMLRPNDLIWPYVVGNYLMGEPPAAFDLLYWNSDSTRMPAANHTFYLRACYLENRLALGRMELGGIRLDLGKVTIPVYELATREDHIAPARSVYAGARLLGGPVTMVVAGSGHIAGVVNPPARQKYQHWTDGDAAAPDLDGWLATAREHPGSWWPHWHAWVAGLDGATVPARRISPRRRRYRPIEDAPGSYVKVKS